MLKKDDKVTFNVAGLELNYGVYHQVGWSERAYLRRGGFNGLLFCLLGIDGSKLFTNAGIKILASHPNDWPEVTGLEDLERQINVVRRYIDEYPVKPSAIDAVFLHHSFGCQSVHAFKLCRLLKDSTC